MRASHATAPHPPRTTRAAEIRKQNTVVKTQQLQRAEQEAAAAAATADDDDIINIAAMANSSRTLNRKAQQQQQQTQASNTAALTQQAALQLQSFETILSLMDNAGTAEQFDRHASQLAPVLAHLLAQPVIPARLVDPSSPKGGLAAVVRRVCVAVAGNAAAAAALSTPALSQLLTLAALPIQCSTLHDQRALPSCVMALLDAVALALQEPHTLQIRTQAATVIRDIVRRVNERCGVDVRATGGSGNFNHAAGGGGASRKAIADSSNNNNVTTGSAIRDLRAAVTKRSVLALVDAWRSAIQREFESTVAYAKAANNNSSSNVNGRMSAQSDDVDVSSRQNQQQDNNNSSVSAANDVTVEGINRQLAHRDHSLEVIAILQALTAATSVRSRARWLVVADDASNNGNNSSSSTLDVDELVFSTLRLSEGDPRTALCVELVWNLLQLCPAEAAFLASRNSYAVLQATLRVTVAEGHVAARRELRNDILVVFGLLSDAAPDSRCVETNLVDLVLELACGVELGLDHHQQQSSSAAAAGNSATAQLQRQFKQHHTTRAEDMQMKLIAWDLLRRWCVADEALAEYAFSCHLFDALLCYIDVTCESRAVVAWSTPQLLELQEHVLRVLEELVRVGCDWFCAARGPAICVSYVLECPAKPASLLQHAISLLAEAAASPARKLIAGCGALPLALRLLASVPLSRETIQRHVNCLTLIADLVDRTAEYQQEFAANRGVDMLMPMLAGAVELADLGDDELMLACVDCVWACVLGCQRNEDRFLELGGVGALLGLLDMRKVLKEQRETKAKTLGAQAVAAGIIGNGTNRSATGGNNNSVLSLAQQKRKQQQRQQGGETIVDEDDDEEHEDDGVDPIADDDDHANFPLACLADVLLIPGASDFARKWRSPRTGRSGVQVLLSLWKMAAVPADIIKQGAITARTATRFDVGCAMLGKASREPLPIGEEEQAAQRAEQRKRKRQEKHRQHQLPEEDYNRQAGGGGDDDDEENDADDNGEGEGDDDDAPDNVMTITTREKEPSFVARSGIVVAPRDIRVLATEFRKNFKVYAALASVGYNGHHELELEERATLTTIQQFLALCKDEVWETVSNSLLSAGVEPTSADWETLRLLREAAEQRAGGLQATRAAFMEMQRRGREAAEKTFYEALIKRTEERLTGTDLANKSGGTQQPVNPHDMRRRTSKFLNSELNAPRRVGYAPGGATVSGGDDMTGEDDEQQQNLLGGMGPTTSGLSITEAKMRNKQMLRSSFKYPVRKTASQQLQQQQQQDQQQQHQEQKPADEDDDDATKHEEDAHALHNALLNVAGGAAQRKGTAPAAGASAVTAIPTSAGSVALERHGAGKGAMSEDEFQIYKAINTLRLEPKAFVPVFEAALRRYDAATGHIQPDPHTNDDAIACEEGRECILEAIRFLQSARPLSILLDVPLGMMYASRDFARRAAGRLDRLTDDDGDAQNSLEGRLKRYGRIEPSATQLQATSKTLQLLATGCFTPESVVLQLVLGDGDPSRPERAALFSPDFKCFSTAVTNHPVYKRIVQIALATHYVDKPAAEQRAAHQALWDL